MHKITNFLYLLVLTTSFSFGQTTLILQPNGVNGKDAKIWSNGPTNNYGNAESITAYTWTNSGNLGIKRFLLEFDLSTIPANATVTSAKLSLYNNPTDLYDGGIHSGNNDIYIERVTSGWSESTLNWNNQPSTTTTNRVSIPPSSNQNQDYLSIDVTNLVLDMSNLSTNNFGFMVRMQDEVNYYKRVVFASSDHPNSSLRPKLEIVYEEQVEESNCMTFKPNSVKGKDAQVWSNGPTNNYANAESINIYTWTNSGSLGVKRVFLEFDFSIIPSNATITSAEMSLFHNPDDLYDGAAHSGTNEMYIERVTSAWDESTINWSNQPTTTTAGRVSLSSSSSATQDYLDIDVTNLVSSMHNPSNGNYGFLVRMQNEQNYYRKSVFASSDHPTVSLRPEITICWEAEGSLSVDNHEKELSLEIYPNPSNGIFNLKFGNEQKNYNLQVLDPTGKLYKDYTFTNNSMVISDKGVYIIQVSDEKGHSITKRVVVL